MVFYLSLMYNIKTQKNGFAQISSEQNENKNFPPRPLRLSPKVNQKVLAISERKSTHNHMSGKAIGGDKKKKKDELPCAANLKSTGSSKLVTNKQLVIT